MNIEKERSVLENQPGLSKTLGMEFLSTPEPDTVMARMKVGGNHLRAVREGDTVTAYAKLQFKGNTLHEWQVDIRNSNDELISTVHVTNYVITPRKD